MSLGSWAAGWVAMQLSEADVNLDVLMRDVQLFVDGRVTAGAPPDDLPRLIGHRLTRGETASVSGPPARRAFWWPRTTERTRRW